MTRWVTDPADWAKLATLVRERGHMGWDSETTGHNVKETSPAFRAEIDMWSLALKTGDDWVGVVLPREALVSGPLRSVLEDPAVIKDAHNARHDVHAADNYGVTVRGVYDTLEGARLAFPGLASYTLKALRVEVLHKPERETFKQLTRPMIERTAVNSVACVCCKKGCRKKSYPHVQYVVPKYKERKVLLDIGDIGPDHERWAEKLAYAAADAEDAPELGEAVRAKLVSLCVKLPELPW